MVLFAHVGHADGIFSQSGFQCLIVILVYILVACEPTSACTCESISFSRSHFYVLFFMDALWLRRG